MPALDPAVAVALAVLVGTVGLWLGWRARSFWIRRRLARNRRLGARGARVAERLLRRAGYVVLEREVAASMRLVVDGAPVSFPVRADALVGRGRRLFVAEFKAGPEASRLENRSTRRQLLEYAHAFGVQSILLVDAHRRRIREVAFEGEMVAPAHADHGA